MLLGHPQICLYQPEIPQNTGNIGRIAAATQCRLHLIKPFGFSVHDKNLRRPGLDYWPYLDLEIHDDMTSCIGDASPGELAFFSVRGKKPYYQMPSTVKYLVFGQETKGLPPGLWEEYPEHFYHIPMYHPGVRSLNLANSVSVVLYHQLMVLKQSEDIR
jgi:tRNA (cytidine/uridine-2'-O-)-methyltransferase